MKTGFNKILFPIVAALLGTLSACSAPEEKKKPQKPVSINKPQTVDSEKVIDNKFTQIVSNLCGNVEFEDLKYTNKNTEIISLDIRTSTDCFLFASEINCGFPAGTCGDDIQVIMKGAGGYHAVFEACGYIYNSLSEINHGIKSFVYGTSDGYKIKVAWNGKRFTEQTLAINNLNYSSIKEISKLTKIVESDFTPEDPKNEDGLHTRVRIEPVDIGREKSLKLYTVMLEQEPEYFLFDSENSAGVARLLLHTTKVSAIQSLPDFAKDYPDLLITSPDEKSGKLSTHTWRYERHQKIYRPIKKPK